MSVPARRGRNEAAGETTFDFGSGRPFDALDAGEPIHPPRERGGSMLSATLVLLVLFGGGWAVLQAPADWLARLGSQVDAVTALLRPPGASVVMSDASSIAIAEPQAADAAAGAIAPMAETQASVAADAATPPDAVPVETGSVDAAAETEEPQPLPPPRIDPANPYQRRALAVGLHPDLSRVLLKRMSAADYRNAGYAIDTAIAKTADGADFVWPRQRRPEQALFRVHFVKGAAAQCRRYVVTVVIDGWSTTALPMERCGAQLTGRESNAGVEKAAVSGR